jgi:DNA-binding Lrp family transcriptional regulator
MTNKPSTDKVVLAALAGHSMATVAKIAAAVKLSRSTVSRTLVKLERSGKAARVVGRHEGGRRKPDIWVRVRSRSRKPTAGKRLPPGELDGLVLGYLRERRKDGPLGPTAVARGLGRSSGAVGNCLARLAAAGSVRQVGGHPRRYTTARGGRSR